MAFVLADLVEETTQTVGTGGFVLEGPVSGSRSFAAGVGATNDTYYVYRDFTNNAFEVGVGTVGASGLTLSRDSVLESSNGGLKVVAQTGVKTLYCSQPSSSITDRQNPVVFAQGLTVTGTLVCAGATFTTVTASGAVTGSNLVGLVANGKTGDWAVTGDISAANITASNQITSDEIESIFDVVVGNDLSVSGTTTVGDFLAVGLSTIDDLDVTDSLTLTPEITESLLSGLGIQLGTDVDVGIDNVFATSGANNVMMCSLLLPATNKSATYVHVIYTIDCTGQQIGGGMNISVSRNYTVAGGGTYTPSDLGPTSASASFGSLSAAVLAEGSMTFSVVYLLTGVMDSHFTPGVDVTVTSSDGSSISTDVRCSSKYYYLS